MSSLKNLYLLGYNVACAAGWAYVLITCAQHIVSGKSEQPQALYDEVEQVLKIVQTAAIMEVLHALLGVVRSPWFTTLLQVASRVTILWGFLWAIPSTQGQIGATLCITSWAAVEIPRYLFYAFNVMGSSPYPLFYLRYSLFFVLYPTGISGELLTVWAALPTLKDSSAISLSVGPVTVSGYMVALAILAVYVPGAPFMYMNMVSNRKSAFKKRNAGVGDSKKTA